MVRHAAVDEMLDPGFLGCVGQQPPDGKLVSKGDSVDECSVCSMEELGHKSFVLQRTFNDSHIVELRELDCHRMRVLEDVGSNIEAKSGRNSGD